MHRRSIIKSESQARPSTHKIYMSINLDYDNYKDIREYTIENHYDLSTVVENFLTKWLEMKKAGFSEKKTIKEYITKGTGSVLRKTPYNPNGTAVHQRKSQFNLSFDNELMMLIKTDPKMRELNISSMCNKFLWDVYYELHPELKDNEGE